MLDAVFIVNPRAGRGAGANAQRLIESWRSSSSAAIEVRATQHAGEATELARTAPDARMFVSVGGDGTHRNVLNGMLSRSYVPMLGIMAAGTGNDLSRTVQWQPPRSLEDVLNGQIKRIDVARSPNGFWMNAAGVGFDAMVAARINQGIRWLSGRAAYLFAIVTELRKYKPIPIRVDVDGQQFEDRAMLCAVANCRSYGGGLLIAPQAQVEDGLLDIVVVGDLRKAEFLIQFPKVLNGAHLSHPKVKSLRGRKISVSAPSTAPVLYDGELGPSGSLLAEVVGSVEARDSASSSLSAQ